MIRSILAVLAGYFATSILVVLFVFLAARLFIPPEFLQATPPRITTAYLVANIATGFLSAIVGGWLAARLAPSHPLAHAGALAGVMLMMSLSGQIRPQKDGASARPTTDQPSWYMPATVALGMAGAIAGGLLRRLGNREARDSAGAAG